MLRKIGTFKKFLALVLALSMIFVAALSACTEADTGSHEENELREDPPATAPPINIGPGTSDLTPERLASLYDPKNYEGEFELGAVLVGMNRGAPVPDNLADLFPELDIVEIYDIDRNRIGRNDLSHDALDTVYKIKLPQETRESVIEAIEILKQNPNVAYAQPNYISYPA